MAGQVPQNRGLIISQGHRFDLLVTTTSTFRYTIDELKELFNNPELKVAYYDLTDNTYNDFFNCDLYLAACGQRSVIGLSVIYAYHFVVSGYPSKAPIEIMTNYILLNSLEYYEKFKKYAFDEMPYTKEKLQILYKSLDEGLELLEQFASDYSLSDVVSRHM